MDFDCDITIVGGGLNGPALALALADGGFNVSVVDAAPKALRGRSGFDGRGYALALASQRLFSALGVWAAVERNAQPILEIKITDGAVETGPGPWMLHFHHAEIEEGPMGFVVEDRYLSRALTKAMADHPKITHMPGQTVIAQEPGLAHVVATLETGKTLTSRLLIGADGRQGGVATRAGIKKQGWGYGQTALVCALDIEKPHDGIAHQYFLPSGPLAILPLPGEKVSIVWSERDQMADAINGMDDKEYLEVLRPRFGDFLGNIKLAGKRFSYPLGLSLADHFVASRIALVGDAAHGVHPIAGQGLNLGLRDVGAMAEVLIEAKRRGEDIGGADVLARYQQWRRWDSSAMAIATDGFNRLFSNDNRGVRTIRDFGLGVVNAIPGLRRRFIREAAGLTGDLPKLLQGRQI